MLIMPITTLATDIPTRLQQIVEAANAVYGKNTPLAKLCAAQAVLESRLLGKPSLLAQLYNNYFGIKVNLKTKANMGTRGYVNLITKEHTNGKWSSPKQPFAWNSTIEDSFTQHKNLLTKPRYQKVMQAKDFPTAATEIKKAGYATDPAYTASLISIYNKYLKSLFK